MTGWNQVEWGNPGACSQCGEFHSKGWAFYVEDPFPGYWKMFTCTACAEALCDDKEES